MKTQKGQITLVNFLAIFVTFILYMILVPVLTPMIETLVVQLSGTPNEVTPAIIMLLRLMPFVLLLAIVLTTFNYAIPRREGM